MWWIILISLFLILIAILLLAPVELEIDSATNMYRVRWWVLIGARVVPAESDVWIEGRLFGFRKRWSLLEVINKRTDRLGKKDEKKKPKRKKKRQISFQTIRKLLKSFKVERFDISMDTGSVMWNAMLFPITEVLHYSLRQKHPGFRINFKGHQHVDLKISNRGLNVVRAFIS